MMTSQQNQESLTCTICTQRLTNPHLLPCLHAFCLACLKDECTEKSRDRFFCPFCLSDSENRRTHHARPWHSFQKILQSEIDGPSVSEDDPTNDDDEENDNESDEQEIVGENDSTTSHESQIPCSVHGDKVADKFCEKCNQLACHKCITSFHRRCQNFSSITEAVNNKREMFESLHNKMADSLVKCEQSWDIQTRKRQHVEEMRRKVIQDIQDCKSAMVNTILEKEQTLINEANKMFDDMMKNATESENTLQKLTLAFYKQLDVLSMSLSVGGEGELLAYLPSLVCRVEMGAKRAVDEQEKDVVKQVTFTPNKNCMDTVASSPLGSLTGQQEAGETSQRGDQFSEAKVEEKLNLSLALLTSFHGGSHDDVAEPLLTDLVILANGDVILTDRDNKCVKKFNFNGKLLTRVVIEAVPSRIAVVSHTKAVVSVMNKKSLYFLSLFGTIRILSSVRVKKIYSFLTSLGGGNLVAGTNHCDSIDILSDSGQLLKNIYTQRGDRASISRPLYLTPVIQVFSINDSSNNNNHQNDLLQNGNNHTPSSSQDVDTNHSKGHHSNKQPSHPDVDLLVSDSGKRVLFRLRQDGTVAYTFKSRDDMSLECPLGVTVHDSGLTLLVDRDSDSVLLLDKEGKFIKKVLTSQNSLVKPCGIYAGHRGRVALSQVDGMVKIYSSNVQYS